MNTQGIDSTISWSLVFCLFTFHGDSEKKNELRRRFVDIVPRVSYYDRFKSIVVRK